MAAKKAKAEGPGKTPGLVTASVHQDGDAEVTASIAQASKGDRYALAMLYGHAAAWLRSGKAPPDELRAWLVDVLQDLHATAWTEFKAPPGEKIPEKTRMKWLKDATRFTRGRGQPVSRRSMLEEQALAGDVFHFLTWGWADSVEDAFWKVAEYHEAKGLSNVKSEQVRDAWSRYGKQFGELHRVTR